MDAIRESDVREAVKELAARVPRVGSAELLDLVSALAPEPEHADPGTGFVGTPWAKLAPAPFVPADGRPSVRELLLGLQEALLDREQEDRLPWLAAYVAALTNGWAGFGRTFASLDLHGFAMLMLASVAPSDPPSQEWEAVAFAWLHGVVHGDPPTEAWVGEAASRRRLRLARTRFDEAAIAVCEGAIPRDALDRLRSQSPGVGLDRQQVTDLWLARGSTAQDTEGGIAARIAALDHTERLDWDDEIDEDLAVGHLVGWLLRYDVVVDVSTLLAAPAYAALLVERRTQGLARAHRKVVREIKDELGLTVPLRTQLAFLAWALDQGQERVSPIEALLAGPPHGRARLGQTQGARPGGAPGTVA